MSDNPTPGFGRGGRGAALLLALQNQPRRPGQTSPPATTAQAPQKEPEPEQPKPLGRGAFIQSLLGGRGRAIHPTVTSPPPQQVAHAPDPPLIMGRGRGLALSSLLASKEPSPVQPTSQVTSPVQSTSQVTSPVQSTSQLTSPVQSTSQITSPVPFQRSVTPSERSVSPPVSELEQLDIGKYRGESGQRLNLEVNYVYLKTPAGKGIYEYHVDFQPLVDSKQMKFKLMGDPTIREVIGSVKTFDGMKLYLPLKLEPSPMCFSVQMPTDQSLVTVTLKLVKKSLSSDLIHLYNLLFRKAMRILKMTQVGRNYFDPKGGIPVPQHKLEIWPGYVTAVQEYEGGVMLNCDASFKVLRTITARDVMQDASRQRGDMKEAVTKALLGCIAMTRYNNKTYKIDDIAWDMNPMSTFVTKGGPETTFKDYYKRAYDIEIRDMNQPLLINKAKKKDIKEGEEDKLICLIPELCFMTGLTDAMRSDFKVMKDVASYTRVQPESRQLTLQKFIDNVRNNPEARQCFDSWNLELDPKPISLDGRQLQSETLLFGRGFKGNAGPEADWGRMVTSKSVLVPVHFEKWAVIFPKRDGNKIREFTTMLRNVCPAMGINVGDPQYVEILNDRTETYCQALKDIINPSVQIVVIIFPTPRDDRYSAVKKLCCIERPVPSQVINLKTISDGRKLRSVVQKIALQMNCKLGGELWAVPIPLEGLMVCGMDTYHDNSNGRRSVLAFVASINQNRTRWFSKTKIQNQGQEVADCLAVLFLEAIRKYFQVNHKLPDRIIMYRDGVGDGQMEMISKYEVEQMNSCFKHFTKDYSPQLTVVVVQKRINTRMYGVEQQGNRKMLKNPAPGTILDHTVTRKGWYDFFLISQHVRQGTVTPTHYVVIHDSSNLKPEYVQRISFKMTHLYYNWPGTVRVPAPCQYAHKLAYLVGQNLHKDTAAELSDRLFYL
ncbi:hypothetical protein JTE90_010554 [Oedothorax gibbosus]|uniref:Uncharacterized protein n=1 Tax=Oedothorax gibbosus TaxID=931172 RepID=A0AAV6U3S5_9ARAC|nr:hypothetical protein JTE90_010554 [Oedothorax gibbosus]